MNKTASQMTINPPCYSHGLLSTGHWFTRGGYGTVREKGSMDWLLIFTANGSGRIAQGKNVYYTQPGDIVLWQPGVWQDYRIAEKCSAWEIRWAHFIARPHWLELLNWPVQPQGFRCIQITGKKMRATIGALLEKMHVNATGPLEKKDLFALNALEELLLIADTVNPTSKDAQVDKRIKAAMEYLCANRAQQITLQEIGVQCGLSSSRLSHLFSMQVGVTPMQYLEQQRMSQAQKLLEFSAFNITEITFMIGFVSPFYFSRRFAKYTGLSPREYRMKTASTRPFCG